MTLTLPLKTVSEANRRDHWAARAKRSKAARQLAAWTCIGRLDDVRRGLAAGARYVVTLERLSPRALDDDNLLGALKAVRDGVADALGLTSDRDPRVRWEYGQGRDKVEKHAVRIDVRAEK